MLSIIHFARVLGGFFRKPELFGFRFPPESVSLYLDPDRKEILAHDHFVAVHAFYGAPAEQCSLGLNLFAYDAGKVWKALAGNRPRSAIYLSERGLLTIGNTIVPAVQAETKFYAACQDLLSQGRDPLGFPTTTESEISPSMWARAADFVRPISDTETDPETQTVVYSRGFETVHAKESAPWETVRGGPCFYFRLEDRSQEALLSGVCMAMTRAMGADQNE